MDDHNHTITLFKYFMYNFICYSGNLEHNLPFLTGGIVMPSWFDVYELPIGGVSPYW